MLRNMHESNFANSDLLIGRGKCPCCCRHVPFVSFASHFCLLSAYFTPFPCSFSSHFFFLVSLSVALLSLSVHLCTTSSIPAARTSNQRSKIQPAYRYQRRPRGKRKDEQQISSKLRGRGRDKENKISSKIRERVLQGHKNTMKENSMRHSGRRRKQVKHQRRELANEN